MSKITPRIRSEVGRTPGLPDARGRGGLFSVRPRAVPAITLTGGSQYRAALHGVARGLRGHDVERHLLARTLDAIADDEDDLVGAGFVGRGPRRGVAGLRTDRAIADAPGRRQQLPVRPRKRQAAAVRELLHWRPDVGAAP